ncbi:MAG TPA: ATP-binding protein [Sorangium sp.]|uniref:sensor histidine kinase n=1 Tax=Sorangium sp. So ce1153 TaxID=3133333 RepID=UPI002CA7EF64|nr:ATP-binding protein [Sorangium sp.]
MSIRARLASIFAVALAAVLIAGGALYFTIDQMLLFQQRAEVSYEDLTLHVALASDASQYMNEAVTVALGNTLGLEAAKAAERVTHDLAAIEALKRKLNADPELRESSEEAAEELEHIDLMRESFGRLAAGVAEMSSLGPMRASERHAALEELSQHEYEERFLPHISAAVHDAERDVARVLDDARRLRARVAALGVAATAGALFLLIVLLGRLLRSIDRGVSTLVEGSRRIAQGDLDLRLSALDGHEFGRMSMAFNDMAASLYAAQESKLRMEKLAAVGQLAASVGHDLRNPIGAVRNANHYLKKRLSGTEIGAEPRVAQFLSIIDKELAACTKIIGNLLDFARERRPLFSECAVKSLVEDAISVVEAPPHVRIENDVPDALPAVELDKDQFRQLLVNLIQNAAEAVPAGREGHVRVAAWWTEDRLALSVADNGSGISDEARARLFEPLFSTKLKGTGLGLAISAGIVRRHGGTLDATSELGSGTTFVIQVPTRQSHTMKSCSSAPPGPDGA